MAKIIHKKWFHHIIGILRLQTIFRRLLKFVSPTFRHSGILYRIRSPETFSIASEIFKRPTYDMLLNQTEIHTFIDLGCNTGFFACLLGSRYGFSNIKGILVDADADVLKECEWHLRANHLDNCKTLCAVVGPRDSQMSDFYVSEFNIISSTRPVDKNYPFPTRTIKKVKRQVITLESLVTTIFGAEQVDVLKVDIEGSEVDLLKQNLTCLHRINWVIIEWHKWAIQFDEMTSALSRSSFTLIDILKEDSICGLGLYKNNSPYKTMQSTLENSRG